MWLGLWAVTVDSSTFWGLSDSLLRVIASRSTLTPSTTQILCVVLVAGWLKIVPTGARTQALVSFEVRR